MEQKHRKPLQGSAILPAVSCILVLALTVNLTFHFVRFDLGLIKELSESESREQALNRPSSSFLSPSKIIKATTENGPDNNEDHARVLRKSDVKADATNQKGKEKQKKGKEKRKDNSKENEEAIDPDAPKDMYFRDPKATLVAWDYFPEREPRRDASWAKAEPLTSSSEPPDEMECDRLMNHIDTSPPPKREASNRACETYDGVLHIDRYDGGGASGAAFFCFTIGMLAWAEQHNYLAWIHIDNGFTKPIWDPVVHMNTTNSSPTTFRMLEGMDIDWARDPRDKYSHKFPGKPFVREELLAHDFEVKGTGVWEHYFLPPNDFVPGDISCQNKPLVRFDLDHIVPGIHANAPYAPRPWRFSEAKYLIRKDLSWDDWFRPQRKHGAEVTERYIRFNPMMERRARCAFPNPEFSLGMHIRHGDKAEREILEVERFFGIAEAFVNNGGRSIYLATDSKVVVDNIMKEWPEHITDHIVRQPSVEGLTSDHFAAFDLGISSHRTNIEALTDIIGLSKCTFLLHGMSAMTEAALYLNPGLVTRSVNIEDPQYSDYSPDDFVKYMMPLGKG